MCDYLRLTSKIRCDVDKIHLQSDTSLNFKNTLHPRHFEHLYELDANIHQESAYESQRW